MPNRLFVVAMLAVAFVASACGGSKSPTAPGTGAPAAVTVSSLTVSASQVSAGSSAQGTAVLSAAAPTGGTVVALSANDSAAAVPPSITIPAGSTSGTFTITTDAVSAITDIVITGSAGGVSRTASIRVTPIAPGVTLASVAITPSAVQGGIPTTGKVTLRAAAPAGGEAVALSSNDPFATVPASIIVPAGDTTANFSVTTRLPPGSRDVTITATAGGESRTTLLKVSPTPPPPPVLSSISIGAAAQGGTLTLTLTGANFVDGWGLSVAVSGTGVTVTNVTVLSDASMNVTLAISSTAPLGPRQITVSTAGRSSGAMTLSVVAPTAAPVASADSYAATEDVALIVPAGGVLSNDTDANGDALTAALVGAPANGSLTLNANGSFTYTPNANFNGSDSFTYRANDGSANSNTATVTLTVGAVNDAPVAVANSGTTNEDIVLNVAAGAGVLTNDTDVDGDSLTASLVSGPANGALTLNANGSYQYTPSENFSGSDSFTYRASDGTANSNTVTVSLTINSVVDVVEFTFTGGAQTFTVPPGVTSIRIEASGAQGGNGGAGAAGGNGGTTHATITGLVPGQVLQVNVGGQGATATGFPSPGGFNGGGSAIGGIGPAGTGGGASDVRSGGFALSDRLVVAGGGGGGGGADGGGAAGLGGEGGSLIGAAGGAGTGAGANGSGGSGGTQGGGGAGGAGDGAPAGRDGSTGSGGAGSLGNGKGGGGGGGLFGGGAGGAADDALGAEAGGGGGGGSSFAIATAFVVTHVQGNRSRDGIVIIRY